MAVDARYFHSVLFSASTQHQWRNN